jgi:hypothetical protein
VIHSDTAKFGVFCAAFANVKVYLALRDLIENNMSLREAAKKHGIPHRTLHAAKNRLRAFGDKYRKVRLAEEQAETI